MTVRKSAPTAPSAAPSVGVAMPAMMEPSEEMSRTVIGTIPLMNSTSSSSFEPERSSSASAGPSDGLR